MADVIKIKSGEGVPPRLQGQELGYSKDKKVLYIGTENGNVRLCGADDIEELRQVINDINARLTSLQNE